MFATVRRFAIYLLLIEKYFLKLSHVSVMSVNGFTIIHSYMFAESQYKITNIFKLTHETS